MSSIKYVDEYGEVEQYQLRYIEHYRTRHPDGDSHCGTCYLGEEACENCKEIWRVVECGCSHSDPKPHPMWSTVCYSEAEANLYLENLKKRMGD